MSIFLLFQTIIDKIDKLRRSFFFGNDGGALANKKKYHLVKWTKYAKVPRKEV